MFCHAIFKKPGSRATWNAALGLGCFEVWVGHRAGVWFSLHIIESGVGGNLRDKYLG